MENITGKYQYSKSENIDEYLTALGVPYLVRKMRGGSSPNMEFKYDGDTMTIKTSSMRPMENTFKLGEEFKETVPRGTFKSVTTKISDNEIVIDSVIQGTGDKCKRHYLFTNDELVETLTHEKAKSPSKRYYSKEK